MPTKKKTNLWVDIAERTVVTGIEAVLAYLGTRLIDVGPEWVMIGTPVLAFIKTQIARLWGNKDSASLAPSV